MTRKQWHRQQLEILINEAETLDGLKVRQLPSSRLIKCTHCGHSGRACIPHQTNAPSFRCSRCKRRN
jgi:DNA-directed RNA polymerase subunit RPC12/RpoP